MKNNNAIFTRVWNDANKYGLAFISSNGGTGKTTFFKFKLLRDAVYNGIPFHIIVRYKNQMETSAQSFLNDKPSYSNRQRKLLAMLEVEKENENFIYLRIKETKQRIAMFLNVYNQSYYKPYGNTILAKRAFFDEILAEDGNYVPDEMNKFARLIFTMARSDEEYKVYGLYNNTRPYFDYFTYYHAKNYTTHTSDSGARFIYFIARQWRKDNKEFDSHSIQSIIQKTDYNAVYTNNEFTQYPTYYRNEDLTNTPILLKLEIENKLFKLRRKNGILFLDDKKAYKKSKHIIFTTNEPSRTEYEQLPPNIAVKLKQYISICKLKTNDINNTIFCEILNNKL